MAEKPVRGIAPVERLLERLLREWKPDAVVCTYMVYPYILDSLASRTGRAVPYLTVVTDSFVSNKSWLCSKSPLWAVTDPWTRASMEEKGLPQDRLRAVSYTHLQRRRPEPFDSIRRRQFRRDGCLPGESFGPVSYTHLDVYKRQR